MAGPWHCNGCSRREEYLDEGETDFSSAAVVLYVNLDNRVLDMQTQTRTLSPLPHYFIAEA